MVRTPSISVSYILVTKACVRVRASVGSERKTDRLVNHVVHMCVNVLGVLIVLCVCVCVCVRASSTRSGNWQDN